MVDIRLPPWGRSKFDLATPKYRQGFLMFPIRSPCSRMRFFGLARLGHPSHADAALRHRVAPIDSDFVAEESERVELPHPEA